MQRDRQRISIDPEICGGRPCVAGTRVRVIDIVDAISCGADRAAILADFPYLSAEDIDAALEYAQQFGIHASAPAR